MTAKCAVIGIVVQGTESGPGHRIVVQGIGTDNDPAARPFSATDRAGSSGSTHTVNSGSGLPRCPVRPARGIQVWHCADSYR